VAGRLIAAGHWHDGDPDILVVFDGYDLTRLAWLLRDLPVEVLGRLRSDRVMYFPAPAREPGTNGRPLRHGAAFRLAGKQPWPAPAVTTVTETARYGTATALAWGRLHQRLASRAGWENHDGELPVIAGHPDPPGRRSPARRSPPRTAVAMVITRRNRRRGERRLAGVPAPLGAGERLFGETSDKKPMRLSTPGHSVTTSSSSPTSPSETPSGRRTAPAFLKTSRALEAGTDIRIVSEMLGHSTTRITQDLYQHVRVQLQIDAAETAVELLSGRKGACETGS
jgi:DDE superfamily endonuclease